MTDTPTPQGPAPEEPSRLEEIKTQARKAVENLKADLLVRLDQALDEIGAII